MNLMILRGYIMLMLLKIALAGMVVYAHWRHLLISKFNNVSWFTLHELNSHLFIYLPTFYLHFFIYRIGFQENSPRENSHPGNSHPSNYPLENSPSPQNISTHFISCLSSLNTSSINGGSVYITSPSLNKKLWFLRWQGQLTGEGVKRGQFTGEN